MTAAVASTRGHLLAGRLCRCSRPPVCQCCALICPHPTLRCSHLWSHPALTPRSHCPLYPTMLPFPLYPTMLLSPPVPHHAPIAPHTPPCSHCPLYPSTLPLPPLDSLHFDTSITSSSPFALSSPHPTAPHYLHCIPCAQPEQAPSGYRCLLSCSCTGMVLHHGCAAATALHCSVLSVPPLLCSARTSGPCHEPGVFPATQTFLCSGSVPSAHAR